MADKICVICGNHMTNVRVDKKYCCRACQSKGARQTAKKDRTKICAKCEKSFEPKTYACQRRYCYDCVQESAYHNGAELRNIVKKWSLEEKGGKCSFCGYDKCSEALDFHHIDPEKKDFSLSDRNLIFDWTVIKEELSKCILVCSNCHREIHAGIRKI